MKLKELGFDEKNRVFINTDKVIDYSDGEKNEEYIFDSLKNAKDTSIYSMELFNCIRDWSSEYHFTTYRSNILRSLNIKKGHHVLEIGAGCGAITRYLGETGAKITAVEGSLSRARCIAERCRDLDNVTVICSNVEDIEFEEKFDVVTLIGVFEYTAKYSNRDNPFSAALNSYANLLKPNGALVIAIENKLGLKYFAGFNEDHFATAYFGLEGRYGEKDITTFGYDEIKDMLGKSGFGTTKFLFPFPDYKLPKVVITDQGLARKEFNVADLIRFTKDRHYNPRPKANLLNEYLVWESIAENGLIKDLSNSFLIVATKNQTQELVDDSLLSQYYTCNRVEPHNTATTFYSATTKGIAVRKNHLGSVEGKQATAGISHDLDGETTYIPGRNLHHLITGALLRHQYKEYERLMAKWVDYLKSFAMVDKASNTKWVKPDYFDALPFNMIEDHNGKLHLFDQEWHIEEKFDLPFLMVRYLGMHRRNKEIYGDYANDFGNFINKTLKFCGLNPLSANTLKQYRNLDETIRAKINRVGGQAPLQLKKSLVFLMLAKLKEIKAYLYSGRFAQR
ncbi:MAG: class I SAM-dependent methyltransferase [Flavobacteriaceae bacterium]